MSEEDEEIGLSRYREDLVDEAKGVERLLRAGMIDDSTDYMFYNPRVDDLPSKMVHRMYGSCTKPVRMPVGNASDYEKAVRCRRCPGCLRARRTLWRYRAEEEFLLSPRTWFFTGTFANQTDNMILVNREVTAFLSRLRRRMEYQREKDGPRSSVGYLRYIIAPEPHKSGMLHVHALLHTGSGTQRRMISDSWKAGFEKTKLADLEHAGYVTKYVTKNLVEKKARRPRVRASRDPRYGNAVMCTDEIAVQEMLRKRKAMTGDTWLKNMRMSLAETARNRPENQPLWKKLASLEYSENLLELDRTNYRTL